MLVTKKDFDRVVAQLAQPGIYSFDCETSGLKETDRLFSMAFYGSGGGFYFNFQEYPDLDSDLILPRDLLEKMRHIFENKESTWFIQNAKFDMRMIYYEGIEIKGKVICTQATERVLKNNIIGKRPYSLEMCAERRGWKKDDAVENYISEHKLYTWEQIPGKSEPQKNKLFHKVPFDIISKYALIDAELCFKIGMDQALKLQQMDQDKGPMVQNIGNIYNNESNLVKTCFKMERTGIKIDRDYTKRALEYESVKIKALSDKFSDMTGLEFNDGRTTLQAAFDKAGEEYPETPKGNASFSSEILDKMESPLAALVSDIRYHTKRLNTYYSSFLLYADENDVIHPTMWQSGTETGRFSYSNPNLQNVPKEDEVCDDLPFLVRKCFVPRDGFFFLSMDYKQQEFKMMLDYAGQKSLIAKVNAGEDVHQATAAEMGISRKFAKTVNFGLLYGMGVKKLGKALGISEKEAKELKNNYFDKFPGIQRFLFQCAQKAREQGYVTNWLGRRCHISDPQYAYIIPNHIIQGNCADVIKLSMNKIHQYVNSEMLSSRMILQIHDELLWEFNMSELEHIPKIKDIMESTYKSKNGIKLDVDIDYSFISWGAKDKIKGAPDVEAKRGPP